LPWKISVIDGSVIFSLVVFKSSLLLEFSPQP
jgi:hypothetical protein